MKEIRVLLVEDDDAQARLVTEQLRGRSDVVVVRRCDTLAETVAALQAQPGGFDVVLLDLGLPDSEGQETVLEVRRNAMRPAIVVHSGMHDVSVALAAMRKGAQDYVVKGAVDGANLARLLQLAIERKRLQDTEQMLVGVVSHDLRGPLQTIVLGCDMLRRDNPSPRIEAIHRAAIRATALVNDLLDATRARLAGVLPVEIVECDLAEVVREALDETHLMYPNRTFDAQLPAGAVARVDPKRIAQVVTNLVGNAVQHSAASAPVRIALQSHADGHELSIHNDGTIPAAVRQRMFEPLEREGGEGNGHNIGLGLYIVSEIVRAHGGAISVDSDAERGTTFSVRLPS